MTKLILTAKGALQSKDGRKVAHTFATLGLSRVSLEGVLAAFADTEYTVEQVDAAIAAANAKRGSVIPNGYRYQYGADQNCGDAVAKTLTALVTDPKTGVDLDKCREVARANDVEDRFDAWLVKDLNPGMVRMNLGNVLRGMARRDEVVVIGGTTFAPAE